MNFDLCICDACKSIRKSKNQSIYCITQACKCAKAESCLRSICMYIVYEFKVWIKRCYCSVCDCAACKSIWKCEKSIYCITSVCICTKAESCLCNICMYVVCELQHVRKDVAVLLCMCKLQHVNDHVVIVSLFNCVWTQCMSKALLLLCQCWWDCSAFLTSITYKRFVVSILYR